MRSIESASSVFYHSQEEEPGRTAADSQSSSRDVHPAPLCDSYHDSMMDGGTGTAEHDASGTNAAHASTMKQSVAISRMCSVEDCVVCVLGFFSFLFALLQLLQLLQFLSVLSAVPTRMNSFEKKNHPKLDKTIINQLSLSLVTL